MRLVRLRNLLLIPAGVTLVLGIGTAPAFADTLPSTTPTMTAPANGSNAVGVVTISAATTTPWAQFFLDGVAYGGPMVATAGSASTTWATWGLANSGPHVWSAVDCNNAGCSTVQSAGRTVATIANATPTMTAPANGATTDRSLTLRASAPGGGLAFAVDGVVVGFDATPPYSVVLAGPVPLGVHSASVRGCNTTGSTCLGPTSPAIGFAVKALHPQITSLAPRRFSPIHGGTKNQTTFRVRLTGTQHVSFSVRNANGKVVQGPHALGRLAAGTHTFHWNGRTNAGRIAPDGLYTIAVTSSAASGNATLHGSATALVRVDDSASRLSSINGSGATFYPVADGYADTFGPQVQVNEGGGLWLYIDTMSGATVRVFAHPHAGAGTFKFTWSGRDAGGGMVAAGTYKYRFVAQDVAGNRSVSAYRIVHLSNAHIVNKSVSYTENGDVGDVLASNTSCTQYSYGLSRYTHGVWLSNVCDPALDDFQVILANYSFAVPGALRYNSIQVQSYGNSIDTPEYVVATIYNYAAGTWNSVGGVALTQYSADGWANYGTVAGAGRVSGSHVVTVGVGVPNDPNHFTDYDIGSVAITVSYSVLE